MLTLLILLLIFSYHVPYSVYVLPAHLALHVRQMNRMTIFGGVLQTQNVFIMSSSGVVIVHVLENGVAEVLSRGKSLLVFITNSWDTAFIL